MTPDELRALADALIECGEDAWPTPPGPIQRAADYLRAQAEAQPVAWMHDGLVSTNKERVEHDEMRNRSCGFKPKPIIPLYAAPASPQAEPIDPHMIVAEDRFPDEQAEPPSEEVIEGVEDYLTDFREQIHAVTDLTQWATAIAGYVLLVHGRQSTEPQAEPKREPLDDDEIIRLAWQQNVWTDGMIEFSFLAFARAVERAHGISGGGHD